ncbi:hypothetical protein BH09PSE5_BH09PSE5_45570 [soil metagenome]
MIGSRLEAGRDASLDASRNINIVAATSASEQQHNDNSSHRVGVGFNVGAQNGFAVTASASKGDGRADGTDASNNRTSS